MYLQMLSSSGAGGLVTAQNPSLTTREPWVNGNHIGGNRLGKNGHIFLVAQPAHLHQRAQATRALARPRKYVPANFHMR